MAGDNRIAVVTIHGTGDTAEGPDGEKWFQNGSSFVRDLSGKLAAQGLNADVIPHLWSGANSARGREQGTISLTEKLRKLKSDYDAIHLVGHSHGGNVATDAAVAMGWSGDTCKTKVRSITTIGTPFLRGDVGFAEWVASWLFLAFTMLTMIGMVFLLIVGGAMLSGALPGVEERPIEIYETFHRGLAQRDGEVLTAQELRARAEETKASQEGDDRGAGLSAIIFAVVVFVALIPLLRIARGGWRRVSRIRKRARADVAVRNIWHPNDEAIAFLKRVETLPLAPFAPRTLWRGSHRMGINIGVQFVLLVLVAAATLWIMGAAGMQTVLGWTPPDISLSGDAYDSNTGQLIEDTSNPLQRFSGSILLYAGLLLPLVFALAYMATRIVAGLFPELALRGWYNGVVSNAVKGMAFGRDGDERIGRVSAQPHYFGADEHILEGDLAERMKGASEGAADALIRKYRWSLFAVDGDNAGVEALTTDAMTWDSLIHTTYFDHAEVAELIAAHIAAKNAACAT